MAVRRCEHCDELMQEGYSLESEQAGYHLYCSESCMYNEYDHGDPTLAVEVHDWTQVEMDAEDFEILMNVLISDPSPGQIADIFDILNREDASFYGEYGVLNKFIDYLNEQED